MSKKKNSTPAADQSQNAKGKKPTKPVEPQKASFTTDILEPRILMSATWVDTSTDQQELDATQGDDTANGSSVDDIINGLGGDDTLFGNAGNDQMFGDIGNDNMFGGSGNDSLLGGAGQDSLDGGSGNDLLSGGDGNDTLTGGSGNDVLLGNDGDDKLTGDDGEKNYIVNGSFEKYSGGTLGEGQWRGYTQLDGWKLESGPQFEVVDSLHGTVGATDGNAWLDTDASPGDITFSQKVDGLSQGDSYELSFDTRSRGGEGTGVLEVYWNGQKLGTTGGSFADGWKQNSFQLISGSGDGTDTLRFKEIGTGDCVGTALDNVKLLATSAGNDSLFGGAGNDSLDGGLGNDLLDGGDGNDTMFGGLGADTLFGGSGNDILDGGRGNDILNGEAGDDTIVGGSGADVILGGAGNDTINGGAGNDTIRGGLGNDNIVGDDTRNFITNGSFEKYAGSKLSDGAWKAVGSLEGWNLDKGQQFEVVQNNHMGVGGVDGDVWLDTDASPGNIGFSQKVEGLSTGDTYQLSFDTKVRGTGTGSLEVYWNGEKVGTTGGAVGDAWKTNTFNLTGGSGDGTNTLRFVEVGKSDAYGTALDNVRMFAIGNDTIAGGAGNDTIDGGRGNDTISGGEGDDKLLGGEGNDTVKGGSGNDQIEGGAGDDILIGDNDSSDSNNLVVDGNFTNTGVTSVFQTRNTGAAVGGWKVESGTVDVIADYWEANGATGSIDLDGVSPGAISQSIATEPGQTYTVRFDMAGNCDAGSPTKSLQLTAGDASQSFEWTKPANWSHQKMGYETREFTFVATSESTKIVFASMTQPNAANGPYFGPVITKINITPVLAEGNDTLNGGDGNDQIFGNGGNDTLNGGTGNDQLFGGSGDDLLNGGAGNDLIDGGSGIDTASYSDASQGIVADITTGVVTTGADTDTLVSIERIQGSSYDDVFAFSNPQAGATYSVEAGAGYNTVDLSKFPQSSIRMSDNQAVVTLPDGNTFKIEFSDIDYIKTANGGFAMYDPASVAATPAVNLTGVAAQIPAEIDLKAGQSFSLPLNLGNNIASDAVEVRVSGLPAGAKLSAGRDVGQGEWVLKASDLPNIAMTTNSMVSGNFDLKVTASVESSVPLYTENFEAGAKGWNINTTEGSGSLSQSLGRFGGTNGEQGVFKTFAVPAGVTEVVVEFDMLELDSWDGEKFQVFGNDKLITSDTYQGAGRGVDQGSRFAVSDTKNTGNQGFSGWEDQKHSYRLVLPVENGMVKLGFGSTLNQSIADEAWAIDNLVIQANNSLTTMIDVDIDPAVSVKAEMLGELGDGPVGLKLEAVGADVGTLKSVLIENVPASMSLSAGTKLSDGSWQLTPEQANNLQANGELQGSANLTIKSTFETQGTIYSEDFEKGASGWSSNAVTNGGGSLTNFLGRFNEICGTTPGAQTVFKTFDAPPGVTQVEVQFDFLELDSWDGEQFRVFANDQQVSAQQFFTEYSAYQRDVNKANSVAVDDGTQNQGLSGWADQRHRYTISVPVVNGQFKVGFGSTLDQGPGDEAWGVDNVKVTASRTIETTTSLTVQSRQVLGTAGNDTFVAGTKAEAFIGKDGIDTVDYSKSAQGVTVKLDDTDQWGPYGNQKSGGLTGDAAGDTYKSVENVVGSSKDDYIYGAAAGSNAKLGDGNDVFDNSQLDSRVGVDVVDGGAGNDTIWTGRGDDTLIGGSGDDTLSGEEGNDTLIGGSGNDVIYGGAGNDVAVFSGNRVDYDVIRNADGTTTVIDRSTADGVDRIINVESLQFADQTLVDQQGSWTLQGTSGNDNLAGTRAADAIDGGAGNDSIKGGAGNDVLSGGGGTDTISGGDGDDTIASSWAVVDQITRDNPNIKFSEDTGKFYQYVPSGATWAEARDIAANMKVNGVSGHLVTITSQAENDFVYGMTNGTWAWLGGSDAGKEGNWKWEAGQESGQQFSQGQQSVNGSFQNWSNGEPNNVGAAGENFATMWGGGKWNDLNGDAKIGFVVEWELKDVNDTTGDTLSGDAGNDKITGSRFNDTIDGGSGDDRISAGAGDDVVYGDTNPDDIPAGSLVKTGDNLIVNGSFETNLTSNRTWNVFNSVDGWRTGSGAGIEIQEGVAGTAADGSGLVELDSHNNTSIQQTVTTEIGQKYELSVQYSPRPGVPASSNGVEVWWNGNKIDTIVGEGVGLRDTQWRTLNYQVDGNGAQGALELRAIGTSDGLGGYVDNIQMFKLATPESLQTGNDTIDAGAGNDRIYAQAGNDTVNAGSGDDIIDDGAGNDIVNAGTGNDTIMGSAGADKIDGSEGVDTLSFANSKDGVSVNLSTGVGSQGDAAGDTYKSIENVTGSSSNDTIVGNSNANVIDGGDGDDTIIGSTQIEPVKIEAVLTQDNTLTFNAETGKFYKVVTSGASYNDATLAAQNTQVNGVAGRLVTIRSAAENAFVDRLAGSSSVWIGGSDAGKEGEWKWSNGDKFSQVERSVDGQFTNWNGGEPNDVGADGEDALQMYDGGKWNDLNASANLAYVIEWDALAVVAGAGDTLIGGAGNDRITGGASNDTIDGGTGNDVIDGGAGDDTIRGGDGNDVIIGGAGADVIDGGAGIDTIDFSKSTEGVTLKLDDVDFGGPLAFQKAGGVSGDAAGDTYTNVENVVGTSKDDYVFGAAAGSDVKLGDGNDVFDNNQSRIAKDTVDGGAGNDVVWTGKGDDTLVGGSGDDTLFGEEDNDKLDGGTGNDALVGGSGNDFIDGGEGFDRAHFGGNSTDYQVTRNADGSITVKDLRPGSPDGTDRVVNVETLAFADSWLPIDTVAKTVEPVQLTSLTAEPNHLTVRLGGEMGNNAGQRAEPPRYEVWANGEKISTGVVDWATIDRMAAQGAGGFHELKLDVAPGQQLSNVSVRFTNDAYEGKAETDRNMYVDAIEVNGKRFEAEGPSAKYHRGGDEIRGQEGMYWSGTMSFNTSDAPRPTDAHIAENVPGAVVGKIAAIDSNTKVTVSDDRFEIKDGSLKLKDGVSLNFEEASNLDLKITGSNGTDSWTRNIHIGVENVNEANTASTDTFAVTEDGTLKLDANQLLGNDTDLDGDNLRIVGVSGAEHGTVTLLDNGQIEFKADANYSGPAKFSYTVTDAGGLTSTATVEVNVGAVADAANLTAASVSGLEDQAIALNLGAGLVDADGSEVLSVSIKGVPEGFSLSSGTRQADGSWSVAPSELSKVTLSAPKDFNGQVNMTIEATTTESSNGSAAVVSKDFSVSVNAVAEAANVTVGNVTGLEDQAIKLDLAASLSDVDGSESMKIAIKGVPEGFSLSAGTRNADGSWSVEQSDLGKVSINAPKDFNGQVNLTLEATTTEASNGSTSVVSKDFSVNIAEVNDNPYDIKIDNTTIVENAKPGEVVAKLSATDIDDKNLSFRVVGDNAKSFVAVGNELRITDQAKFSFADKPIEKVTVEVSDGRGGIATREIEIAISANSRTIVGTDSVDSLVGTSANDNVVAGAGNDTINTGRGDDTIDAGSGNDVIDAGTGNDTILAGDGNDVIVGSAGADVIDGGAGIDTIDFSKSTEGVTLKLDEVDFGGPLAFQRAGGVSGDAAGDTYTNVENVIGTAKDDYVFGAAAGSDVKLGDGNDVFDNNQSRVGVDVVDGGRGNDTIWTGRGDDTLIGGEGNDVLSGEEDNDTLIGGKGNDVIYGGSGNDVAVFSGNRVDYDVIRNADGTTTVVDRSTADGVDRVINVESLRFADQTLVDQQGAWTLQGSASNDNLVGTRAADTIDGGAGNDNIKGGAGNDVLSGGTGADTISGGDGDDTIAASSAVGDAAGDKLSGDAGNDKITGSQFSDIIDGGSGDDRISSDAGDDLIYGDTNPNDIPAGSLVKTGDNLIVNGSFETNLTSNRTWNVFNEADGWKTTSGGGIEIQEGVAGSAADGSSLVELDSYGNSGIQQTVTTEAGQKYELSVQYSPRPGVPAASNGVEVWWNGKKIDTIVGEGVGLRDTQWRTMTYQVDGNGPQGALELRAIGTSDSLGGYVDNIQMFKLATPESLQSGNDTIDAGAGNDRVFGQGGNDVINAGSGDDSIDGGTGNDALIGGLGNDSIDGGEGFDRAQFGGNATDYQVTRNADGSLTVTDLRPGSPDGTDRVVNVETLAFADSWLPIDTVAKTVEPVQLTSPTAEPNHLTVRLGGEMGNNAGQRAEPPRYEVWANGEKISTGVVDWATIDRMAAQGAGGFHELKLDVAPGQQLSNVSVRFTNDAYEGKAETDRNMYVDAIEVNGERFEAEGPSAKYHRGGDEIRGQEGMYWSGTMSFNTSDAPRPTDARIAENVPGAVVGKIAAIDSNTKVTVSDDRFEIKDGSLKLKDGVSLNFEEASNLDLKITGSNGTDSWSRNVHIGVDNVNEANTASNDTFAVTEDGTLKLDANQLLGNDTDLDGDNLRIVGVSGAEHGTVTLLDNGQIEFKADANYSGPAKFSYTVTDAGGLTSTATVEVNVGAVADAGNLTAANVSGLEDQAIALNLGAGLVDADGSEVLSVSIKGVPEGFSLSSGTRQADGSWSVAPSELSKVTLSAPKDFNGQVNMTVEATTTESSNGSTSLVSKSFTVDIEDVNDNPYDIRLDNTNITEKAQPGDLVAQLNASDVDGDKLTYRVVGDSAKSFVVVGNELRVATGASFDAISRPVEKVVIEVSDGRGGTETREVEIEIANVNDVATTVVDQLVATEDTPLRIDATTLLANDFDIDGDKLQIVGVAGAEHGTVTLLENGQIEFKADANYSGPAKFTYTVSDPDGLTSTATVELQIEAVADASTLKVDKVAGLEDQTVALNLSANLGDTDGSEVLAVKILGVSDGFELTVGERQPDGSWSVPANEVASVGINAPENFFGDIELTVEATTTDGNSVATNSQSFSVSFEDVNDIPVDIRLDATAFSEAVRAGDVVANLSVDDVDDKNLEFRVVGENASRFEVVGNELRVKPDAEFNSTTQPVVRITIEASDGRGGIVTKEIELTVKFDETAAFRNLTPVNQPIDPSAQSAIGQNATIGSSTADDSAVRTEEEIGQAIRDLDKLTASLETSPPIEIEAPEYTNPNQYVTLPPIEKIDWSTVKFSDLVDLDSTIAAINGGSTPTATSPLSGLSESTDTSADSSSTATLQNTESSVLSKLWALVRAYGGLRTK